MTVNDLILKKPPEDAEPLDLGPTYWRTVCTFDWRDPVKVYAQVETALTKDQVLSLAKTLAVAKKVSVMGYVNVEANMAQDVFAADWTTRFLRIGTTDYTGLQSHPLCVPPSQAGGEAPPHFATPHWKGVNPGGFHLQVRHLPGFFDSITASTRYLKVEWIT